MVEKTPFGGVHSLFYTTRLVRKDEPEQLPPLANFFRDNNKGAPVRRAGGRAGRQWRAACARALRGLHCPPLMFTLHSVHAPLCPLSLSPSTPPLALSLHLPLDSPSTHPWLALPAVIRGWYNRVKDSAVAASEQLSANRSLNFLFAAHSGSQFLLALGLPAERARRSRLAHAATRPVLEETTRDAVLLPAPLLAPVSLFRLRGSVPSWITSIHLQHAPSGAGLECVLDNNPDKVGQRLYGSPLFVRRPSAIEGLPSPRIVLRQGTYNGEIAAQLAAINPSSVFIGYQPDSVEVPKGFGGGGGGGSGRHGGGKHGGGKIQ